MIINSLAAMLDAGFAEVQQVFFFLSVSGISLALGITYGQKCYLLLYIYFYMIYVFIIYK